MILLSDYNRKLVIPRWLFYSKAVKTPEMTWPVSHPYASNPVTKKHLAADFSEFRASPTAHEAADLMGAAFVIGDELIAMETARYVRKSAILQKPVIELANHILGGGDKRQVSSDPRARIAESKTFLAEYPNNALGWVERARCYTVLGQVDKAEQCIKVALNLAPSDRFVVRSAVRFFLHADKADQAWYYVQRASAIRFDPWIKATEINIGEVIKKSVKKLKGLLPTDQRPGNIFQYSELIESFGMLEMINGNDSRAKKYFKLAWSKPSHNVITHSEWIVREHFPAMAEIAQVNFGESIEATAWQHYHHLRVDEALRSSIEWSLEEPYARNAFTLGSSISFHNRDFEQGIQIAKRGLKTTPNDFVLQNNLCFGLLKMNSVAEADIEFKKIAPPADGGSQVVYKATKGLLEFTKGNIAQGRVLYHEAMAEAEQLGARELFANAFMHFAMAEIESGTPEASDFAGAALRHSEKLVGVSVMLTRQRLNERLANLNLKKEPLPFDKFHSPKILPGR